MGCASGVRPRKKVIEIDNLSINQKEEKTLL